MKNVILSCIFGLCCYAVILQSRYLQSRTSESQNHHQTKLFDVIELANQQYHIQRSNATFSIMRKWGLPYDEREQEETEHTPSTNSSSSLLLLDTLSIGTQQNLALLEAQLQTWASHKSIRHYFAATELDDADPSCYKTLNERAIDSIVNSCVNEQPLVKGDVKIVSKLFESNQMYSPEGVRRPAGWICAQQRFAVALEKLGTFYKRQLQLNTTLPHFLLVQDDDTYYNMVRIEEFLRGVDPDVPLAEAPCLVRNPKVHNMSWPWGGYGFILSQGAIRNLIRPVDCNDTSKDEFVTNVCTRLEQDLAGEARYFTNGMSISDLMGAHVRNNLFTNYRSDGTWSYCFLGDCAIGYYVNMYYISSHVKDPKFASIPQARIEGTLGNVKKFQQGNCKYRSVETCNDQAHVCHRQSPESMLNQVRHAAVLSPRSFRNLS